ncbi:zinc ABC transporter substrate-binding protein [bacterium]|nr:zinc ABC transporter substrate-binding protein [bacterium]
MKKHALVFTLLMLAVGLMAPVAANAELKVVATLSDLGWLAERVGGDDVDVTTLCPGHQDPHYLPAKPSLTRKLKKADLLVYNGLELEVGWLPLLIKSARNRNVKAGARGELDCSGAVHHILDVPTGQVDRSQGDIHPHGNPHYLLDPRMGVAVARLMAERMAELDPDAADRYHARAADFAVEVEARLPVWHERMLAAVNCPLIVYHQHWEYLLHWLGLNNIGSIEHRPGINPSPQHVEEVTALGRRQDCVYVIAASWDNRKIAQRAAERMDAPLAILPGAVGAMEKAPGYIEMFDLICDNLATAAAAGIRPQEGLTQ